MAAAAGRRTYRATSALVVMILSAALAVFLLGDAVLRAGPAVGLLLAPWVLLALWGVYVFIYVSCVQTDAAGIRVRNLLRIIDVPWGQVDDIELRWQLEIRLRTGGAVRCFGGPSGGRRARMPRRSDRPGEPVDPPATLATDMIRQRWIAAGETDAAAGPVHRSWDVWALGALVVIVAGAIIAVLITGGPS